MSQRLAAVVAQHQMAQIHRLLAALFLSYLLVAAVALAEVPALMVVLAVALVSKNLIRVEARPDKATQAMLGRVVISHQAAAAARVKWATNQSLAEITAVNGHQTQLSMVVAAAVRQMVVALRVVMAVALRERTAREQEIMPLTIVVAAVVAAGKAAHAAAAMAALAS